jgi:hypothetical protein
MTRLLPMVVAVFGVLASCSKGTDAGRTQALVIKVEGMQRGEGGKT